IPFVAIVRLGCARPIPCRVLTLPSPSTATPIWMADQLSILVPPGYNRSMASDSSEVHAGDPLVTPILLAEYSAFRAEIERRGNVQWNVFALQISSAGAISGLAISAAASYALLLVIPFSSYMLGSRYILHDFHIKLIQRYIRESLSGRLSGELHWEQWK